MNMIDRIRQDYNDAEILQKLIEHNYFSDFDWKEIAEHIFNYEVR